MSDSKVKVLMVCLGNICRSPTAEVVFRKSVEQQGLLKHFDIDSAGTGDWHLGHAPDVRATAAAAKRKLDLSPLRARLVTVDDFTDFDYVYAMDKENHKNLSAMCPKQYQHKISLFLDHTGPDTQYNEVPDPYYSGEEGFELVLDLIEEASTNAVASIAQQHSLV